MRTMVSVHDVEDQVPLLGIARPGTVVVVGEGTGSPVASVVSLGQESGLLNLPVHARLEHVIQPAAFGRNLVRISDLCFDRHGILVRTVARQPALLGIIGFQMNGHVYPWLDGYGVDVR